jgi:hypothetical protein
LLSVIFQIATTLLVLLTSLATTLLSVIFQIATTLLPLLTSLATTLLSVVFQIATTLLPLLTPLATTLLSSSNCNYVVGSSNITCNDVVTIFFKLQLRCWQWHYINMCKGMLKTTARAVSSVAWLNRPNFDWQAWENK